MGTTILEPLFWLGAQDSVIAVSDAVQEGASGYFDRDGTASQADLAERGIPSYYAFSTTCAELDEPFDDLDAVYRDLENLGGIFGVPDRAAELIGRMQARVDGVAQRLAGVTERPSVVALEYSEGTAPPIQSLRAVREQRFAEMGCFLGAIGGVRNAEAVELRPSSCTPKAFN